MESEVIREQLVLQARFQSQVLELCNIVEKLVGARHETINKLRASAEYLDAVWLKCR